MDATQAAMMRGIAPHLSDDPEREQRWRHLTEGLADDMTGYVNTNPTNVRNKRIMLEALLDNQLRARGAHSGVDDVLPLSYMPQIFEGFSNALQNLTEAYAGTGTSMGWDASGIPSNAAVFTTQSLGMVRRVFPRMIATDLVSVQPMAQPTGKVFFFDVKYSHAHNTIAAGDRVDDSSAWDEADMRTYASYAVDGTSANVEGVTARELKLAITSTDVVAESKKLAAEWSQESQQDLRVYHGLSADDEIMSATAAEITREIDRILINFIYTTALNSGAGTVSWNKGGYSGTLPSEQKAWDETLYDVFEDAAALIETKRYKRPSWILAGIDFATRIRKLNAFQTIISQSSNGQLGIAQGGRRIFGTLQNVWTVYIDPWFPPNVAIVGYKGDSFMDTGIVYAPYIPFFRTPLFVEPKTFMNKRGIMSRYGKVAVVPETLALVTLTES